MADTFSKFYKQSHKQGPWCLAPPPPPPPTSTSAHPSPTATTTSTTITTTTTMTAATAAATAATSTATTTASAAAADHKSVTRITLRNLGDQKVQRVYNHILKGEGKRGQEGLTTVTCLTSIHVIK